MLKLRVIDDCERRGALPGNTKDCGEAKGEDEFANDSMLYRFVFLSRSVVSLDSSVTAHRREFLLKAPEWSRRTIFLIMANGFRSYVHCAVHKRYLPVCGWICVT